MSESSPSDVLVSTQWLLETLGDPTVRILDCRFYFDDPAGGRARYLEAHVPGALYLDWSKDISQPQGSLQFMAPSAAHLAASMERLGIDDSTTIVGYDDEGGHYVSRLWMVLRRYGHDSVHVLDGGWTKWQAERRPVRAGEEPAPPRARFNVSRERPHLLVGADEVLRSQDDPGTVLLDVRRWSEYTGEEVRSKYGGHIPWATWLPWEDNLNWDGDRTFRSPQEIRERYVSAGVTPDKRIITYCHGGVRASHAALALSRLGYPNVQVYDGSWEEWGSRDDLPRATGSGKKRAP